MTFPQNLQNDRNTLRTFNLTKIPLKHPKYPKPLFLVILEASGVFCSSYKISGMLVVLDILRGILVVL